MRKASSNENPPQDPQKNIPHQISPQQMPQIPQHQYFQQQYHIPSQQLQQPQIQQGVINPYLNPQTHYYGFPQYDQLPQSSTNESLHLSDQIIQNNYLSSDQPHPQFDNAQNPQQFVWIEPNNSIPPQSQHETQIQNITQTLTPNQQISTDTHIEPQLPKNKSPSYGPPVWNEACDKQLVRLVEDTKSNWKKVSRFFKSYKMTAREARERYIKLNPDMEKKFVKFSKEEDQRIEQLYYEYGTDWGKISDFFEQRTPQMLKNRFYSHIQKSKDIVKMKPNKQNSKKNKQDSPKTKNVFQLNDTDVPISQFQQQQKSKKSQ